MKKSIILILFLYSTVISAQNFLANPGFEDINECEEFDASCASEAWFRIPPYDLNIANNVYRKPHQGKVAEVLVVENIYHPLSRRVFLYTKLACPLLQGNTYQVSFFINNFDRKDYQVEVLLSQQELIAGAKNPLNFEPTLIFTPTHEVEKNKETGWRKVQQTFVATGEEVFLTLGYFSKKEVIVERKEANNKKGEVAILVDDVSLIPSNPEEKLCEEFASEVAHLYEQDHRHTNKISIDHNFDLSELELPEWNDNFFEKPNEEEESLEENNLEVSTKPILPNREWGERDTLIFEIPFVAFDFDKSQVKENFKNKLDSFALHIQYLNPEQILFLGHTDSMGPDIYNQQLSEQRAQAVAEYLDTYDFFRKVPSEKIGKGETQPKADNRTLEGRQRNRRVEIVVFKNKTNFSSQ